VVAVNFGTTHLSEFLTQLTNLALLYNKSALPVNSKVPELIPNGNGSIARQNRIVRLAIRSTKIFLKRGCYSSIVDDLPNRCNWSLSPAFFAFNNPFAMGLHRQYHTEENNMTQKIILKQQ
jgi:hypothetical protein